jgi:sugar lactone lactonase YvrE
LAFDANGNLWVAFSGHSTVVEYTTSQLASSGNPSPAVTLSANSGSLSAPVGIAFDAGGNLWVANGSNTVVAFTPAQLAASGSPAPNVTLTANAGSIHGPLFIGFDANGNLWVANGNAGANTVTGFSPSQRATSGSPVPAVTLTSNAGSLTRPAGIAFDASGNMWVSTVANHTVVQFTVAQIASSGSPTPATTISGAALTEPFGLAFDPHVAALPIKP